MAEITHLAWYRQGTISVEDGSTKVTGSGTKFLTAGINPGAALRIDSRPYAWEVAEVVSDTEIQLARPYYGGTISNASYSIDRNHQSTLPADLSARLAKAMGNWEAHYDLDMQKITGMSAYEIACLHGFTGTEAQWVESLKGAGEITALNKKVEPITYNNAPAHNSIFRGKNLGTTVTAAQIQAIRNKTYEDIYCGDVWKLNLPTSGATDAYVWGCDIQGGLILGLYNRNWVYRFIAEDDLAADETINDRIKSGHMYRSTLYTKYLPAILAEIESVIDPAYIITRYDFVGDAARDDTSYASSYGAKFIRSHSIWSNERIYIASARNIAFDAATAHEYTWTDEHIDQIQQNTGWLIINSLMFPYFIHRPFVRSHYRDGFVNLSAFQNINNYQQVTVANHMREDIWNPWNFSGLVLPFVILG